MLSTVLQKFSLWLLSLAVLADTQCADQEPEFYEAEYATTDYAILGKEKQLSLCRVKDSYKGCTIAWLKDGEPVETSGRVYFRSNQQYLFISTVEESDVGNYSCSVTSEGGVISRSLEMETFEIDTGPPFNHQWTGCKLDDTPLGGNVSASCLFSWGGSLDGLICNWKKNNGTAGMEFLFYFPDISHEDRVCEGHPEYPACGNTESINQSDPHIYACLNLYNVTEDYYGVYFLSILAGGDPSNVTLTLKKPVAEPVKKTTNSTLIYTVVFSVVLVILISVMVWHFVKTDVKLYFKDNFGGKTENDGKLYDAYVSYVWNDTDTQFALSLKQHLEKRGYKVFVPEMEITPGGCTVEEIVQALENSRRFIMVLSNGYINGSLAAFEVTSFVDQVSQYKKNIISVVFKDSNIDAENCRTILKHVLRVSRVVKWAGLCDSTPPDVNDDLAVTRQDSTAEWFPSSGTDIIAIERSFGTKVFKELLLGMPPRPRGQSSNGNGIVTTNNDIAMTNHTNGGLSNNI